MAMGMFDKLFGRKDEPAQGGPFVEGDIFYVQHEGDYQVFKLLRHDTQLGAYHVLCYEPIAELPAKDELPQLSVAVYHSPIAVDGFVQPRLLTHADLTDDDLLGYREYIVQTNQVDERVRLAKAHYRAGYDLTTHKQHLAAIAQYDLAIALIPAFFEAIDNRAFCLMDLGRWQDAVAGFTHSLSVNPGSLLCEFSIGECYLRLRDREHAIAQFRKALAIDPQDRLSKEFLAKAEALPR
jgi:tetratricopeptide (TPR) repeat protein